MTQALSAAPTRVIRYSERPELWKDTDAITREVWPEYNLHSEDPNRYFDRLFDEFPEFQFVLYDAGQREVIAEGHTIPCDWDVTSEGLGEGISAMIAAAFDAKAAHRRPSALCALAAEVKYVSWTRENGEPFDPWIRIHTRRGGQIVRPIPHSMRITGTVAEWEEWTGMRFPAGGQYTFPAGLAPLEIDHEHDRGSYWEPNVWITHKL